MAIPLSESVSLAGFEKLARQCDTVETFIRKTDGMDVLYRGHFSGETGDNAFMTDYVGHAAEYAGGYGGEGRIDAFAFNPGDVLFYNDARFEEMRNAYKGLTAKQLAAIYHASLTGDRFANAMMNGGMETGDQVLAKVKSVLRGKAPYSKISGNATVNDLLIPLLQRFAHDHGKNIIAFHGNDYAEYGGQAEYVVGDISKLVNLRDYYSKIRAAPVRN